MVLPAFAGAFIGCPLVAREIENGTHRLAWTQGVTRTRWLAVKLTLGFIPVLAIAAAVGIVELILVDQQGEVVSDPYVHNSNRVSRHSYGQLLEAALFIPQGVQTRICQCRLLHQFAQPIDDRSTDVSIEGQADEMVTNGDKVTQLVSHGEHDMREHWYGQTGRPHWMKLELGYSK